MSAPRTVVIRSGGLGDFVLTLPLLRALARAGRRVRLVTRARYFELVRDTGWVEALHDVDAAGAHRLLSEPTPELREWLRGSELLSFWSDADGQLGAAARACGVRAVRLLVSRPTAPPHVSVRMLRDAGLPDEPDLLATSALARAGSGAGVLWIHPGSGSPAKNAPLEGFAALARAWRGPVVVCTGEAEAADLARYRAAFARSGAEHVVEPTLGELRARLEREAAAFVGNDSGPTHLAAALGVPTAAVFVASDPELWRPVGAHVRLLRDLARLDLAELAAQASARAIEPGASGRGRSSTSPL
jgi:ADP-heptose:LPS heptosyltransferase